MAFDLKYHTDAQLLVESATGIFREADDGTDPPQKDVRYLGSATTGLKWRAKSNPGVDQITATIDYVNGVWVTGTYAVNDIIRAGLYNYQVQSITGTGTTGGASPTFPTTVGATVVDNEVTWINIGLTHLISEVKLATSEGGLSSATAGDPLNLGVELLSGASNATALWIEVDDPNNGVALATDLKVVLNTLQQETV